MSEFGEEDFDGQRIRPQDPYLRLARARLTEFFEQNPEGVFFSRQMEVRFEGEFYHWLTNRALRDLAAQGLLKTERRALVTEGIVNLYWHRRNRYPRRAAARVVRLVDEYSAYTLAEALGRHGEWMVMEGFARNQFVMRGQQTNEYGGRRWTQTNHNVDFVFERDRCAYGVEVKNTLGYMERDELETKVALCKYLGVTPVMVCRMLPKDWIEWVRRQGGFSLILKWQLYHWTHADLAKRVREGLGLPVGAPTRLEDGTMQRFLSWHNRTCVNPPENPQGGLRNPV